MPKKVSGGATVPATDAPDVSTPGADATLPGLPGTDTSDEVITLISQAAGLVCGEIRRLLGGAFDRDHLETWLWLLRRLQVRPVGVTWEGFTATLVQHACLGWVVVFNRAAPLTLQCRLLCHEVVEVLLRTHEIAGDDLPGCDLRDLQCAARDLPLHELRHRIANAVVSALFGGHM